MNRVWLTALLVSSVGGCCTFSTRGYRGPVSDHFDGEVFSNPGPQPSRSVFKLAKWLITRERGPWPDPFEAPFGEKPVARVGRGEMRVTFINHATVLVQMDGLNILTDPVWSQSIGPLQWVGPERYRPPGVRFEDLPPIDLVLISHNHYDHLDLRTLQRLQATHAPKIAAGLGTRAFLNAHGIRNVRDFDWWQSVRISARNTVTSVPVRHFSMRGVCDQDTMLWSGFVVSSPSGDLYFPGDTGYGPHFEVAAARFPNIRLALLPIGAYRPRFFMASVHIDPAEAVRAHRDLRARTSLGIHFGTFRQADDGFAEPVIDLHAALDKAQISRQEFWTLPEGSPRDVPALTVRRVAATRSTRASSTDCLVRFRQLASERPPALLTER